MLKEHFNRKALPVLKAFYLSVRKMPCLQILRGQIKLHAHTAPKEVYLETLCTFYIKLYIQVNGITHSSFGLHKVFEAVFILKLRICFKKKHGWTLHVLDTSFTIIYQRIVACFQNYDSSTCVQCNLMAELYCTLQF